jgi:hypothetical protein
MTLKILNSINRNKTSSPTRTNDISLLYLSHNKLSRVIQHILWCVRTISCIEISPFVIPQITAWLVVTLEAAPLLLPWEWTVLHPTPSANIRTCKTTVRHSRRRGRRLLPAAGPGEFSVFMHCMESQYSIKNMSEFLRIFLEQERTWPRVLRTSGVWFGIAKPSWG